MIDLDYLYTHKTAFGFFSQQLSYPEKLTFHPQVMEGSFTPNDPAFELVKTYWQDIQTYSLDDVQEIYVQTFDFQKRATLYMTYFKFEDAKERGQMLAKLKVMYEMFGLNMPAEELSDYLPLICEFLYAAEWRNDPRAQESFAILFAVLEDGTYHLVKALEELKSPYLTLVKGIRATLKACLIREAVGNEHD
ncbi:nitrate reductase molybdenum cofactor assembly chaperone [Lysinibacillus piscis]|uniref:Nitrate reductase molybdenum cofactor assembly chaperone n=1 Tax=Lysinibacillus piscis TaxID=2518931 RepID=A0ABQ5NL37_9BACI|nr:nitrate reductase molybdenum cofactor assembly chaperone [Lysinibacillus sp. KH24]GLC89018.1 nitrate reductase molybdenum cofactor assembly chaperone [Lysinibacillus sp. KH24]